MNSIKAVVQKIVESGKHGPYVVTKGDNFDGSITFSLEKNIWGEKDLPENGSIIFLSEIRKKRAGWRANKARFWQPLDEQKEQSVITVKSNEHVKFIYPTSRKFPFDEVCEKIVKALEQKKWCVPGMKIEFDEDGSGEDKFRSVLKISGADFQLYFCRVQGQLNKHLNDTAAVDTVTIPGMQISVYEDESGPSLYTYVGNNWDEEKEDFINGSKYHSKLNDKPRTYLCYTGGFKKPEDSGMQFTRSNVRPPYLVIDNDIGREYDPEKGDAKYYTTKKVFTHFTEWLNDNVLDYIQQVKPHKEGLKFVAEECINYPESLINLFTFVDWQTAERINFGKTKVEKLEPSDRYAIQGTGRQLVSYEASNDGTVPELAYDGFLWCGVGSVNEKTYIKNLPIFGHVSDISNDYLVKVVPKSANHIFVADMAARDKYKEIWFKENPEADRLTNEAYHEFLRTSGRTIIPINEYKNNYGKPVVLINRELSFDEVEIVSGPHKK